jgi:hypothetical protein
LTKLPFSILFIRWPQWHTKDFFWRGGLHQEFGGGGGHSTNSVEDREAERTGIWGR